MSRYDILLQQQFDQPVAASATASPVPEPAFDQSAEVSEGGQTFRAAAPESGRSTPVVESDSPDQSTTESTGQSTRQSTGSSARALTAFAVDRGAHETVGRPKAFYITTRLNKRLDAAVRYFQEVWGIKKVDRSAIVNVMLDTDSHWTDKALDQVADRLVRLLASRLTG
jgi:hypothetical protein